MYVGRRFKENIFRFRQTAFWAQKHSQKPNVGGRGLYEKPKPPRYTALRLVILLPVMYNTVPCHIYFRHFIGPKMGLAVFSGQTDLVKSGRSSVAHVREKIPARMWKVLSYGVILLIQITVLHYWCRTEKPHRRIAVHSKACCPCLARNEIPRQCPASAHVVMDRESMLSS